MYRSEIKHTYSTHMRPLSSWAHAGSARARAGEQTRGHISPLYPPVIQTVHKSLRINNDPVRRVVFHPLKPYATLLLSIQLNP